MKPRNRFRPPVDVRDDIDAAAAGASSASSSLAQAEHGLGKRLPTLRKRLRAIALELTGASARLTRLSHFGR